MVYNMGSAIMRAVGDSRRPFIYLVVSAVTNTVLDLLFVKVFKWGVAGVAIATIIAQGVSAVLTVISLCRNESCVKISFKGMKFHRPILKEILVIGLPAALQMTITSFSNIFVQSYINFFGKEAMGGWTAYNKIDMIVLLPMQSLALASTTFVGQNIGKNQVKRAEKGANTALLMSLAATTVLIIPIMIFSGTFIKIFNTNPDIISYGTIFLRWLTPFYLFWCVNQIYSGALRGVGKSTGPMVIMLSSFVAFRQTYLFVVSRFISNTILPIVMGFPAGWVLAAVITFIYYKVTGLKPKEKKTADNVEAVA
jgi:putative MATE family efflux protein